MARVYLFNMMARDRYSDATTVVVNAAVSLPYAMYASLKANDYVPFSTSGALSPATAPQGNQFVASNTLAVTNASGGVNAVYETVRTPSGEGDIVALVFPADLVLYRQSGTLLETCSPSQQVPGPPRATIATTEPGLVYVFNVFSEDVALSSNGGPVATIPGWSDGTGSNPPIYTPFVAKARRVRSQVDGTGAFANGLNDVVLTGIEVPSSFRLPIDGNRFPLNQSLWLVIARDHWVLADQFGVVASQGPVEPIGFTDDTPAPAEETTMTKEATGAGNVYVFNVTSQDLDLSTNGIQTTGGSILGWQQTGTTKYTPNVKAVPRVLNASDGGGKFFNGTNRLSLRWLDGSFSAIVKIDGSSMPLNQDLLLFVVRNQWQLVNQYAVEIGNGDVLPDSELRLMLQHTAKEHA